MDKTAETQETYERREMLDETNHAKAASVQYLARYFNQCRSCFRWVCDECYVLEAFAGACVECAKGKLRCSNFANEGSV